MGGVSFNPYWLRTADAHAFMAASHSGNWSGVGGPEHVSELLLSQSVVNAVAQPSTPRAHRAANKQSCMEERSAVISDLSASFLVRSTCRLLVWHAAKAGRRCCTIAAYARGLCITSPVPKIWTVPTTRERLPAPPTVHSV
jgi:hypothetical protein